MAANYTEHYQLNQWEPEDKVLRTDFNADNLKIDGALHALAGRVNSLNSAVGGKADASALNAEVNTRAAEISAVNARLAKLGNCQIYQETYTGDGTGSRTFTFPYTPMLVVAMGDGAVLRLVRGAAEGLYQYGSDGIRCSVTWEGKSVTFWDGSISMGGSRGCNASGSTYGLVALLSVTD